MRQRGLNLIYVRGNGHLCLLYIQATSSLVSACSCLSVTVPEDILNTERANTSFLFPTN